MKKPTKDTEQNEKVTGKTQRTVEVGVFTGRELRDRDPEKGSFRLDFVVKFVLK